MLLVPQKGDGAPVVKKMPRRTKAKHAIGATTTTALTMPIIRGRFAGYDVSQKLGQGGMGAVYLARETLADRRVALKVLSPQLGADPRVISRLTREAYATAQLCHDNLARIYDIGIQRARGNDLLYFSMEFVEGTTLRDLLRENKKLDCEAAVGYVLQAARGLKFAHDHGLIHRDIKPNNLLLDDQGIVKVADLGLVERAGMVAPAYPLPELEEEGAHIDSRADIYALGCTLYELLTGQAPNPGRSASEAIAKARQVPMPLLFIVMKMMSRRPQDRYQSMSDVVAALESYLGVGKPFPGRSEQAQKVARAAEQFGGAWNQLRNILIAGFLILAAVAIVVLALPWVGYPLLATGMGAFLITGVVVYQVLLGVSQRTLLSIKVRQFFFGGLIWDWLIFLSVAGVGAWVLTALGVQWICLAFGIAAVVVVGTFFSVFDAMRSGDRKEALARTERVLREMRQRGMDEDQVRQFVCKHAGRNWEEFYETLFGYEAKLLARQAWGQGRRGRLRPRVGSWRDPVIAWLDQKIRRRQRNWQRKMLERLEISALQAKGLNPSAAAERARANARRVVEKACVIAQTSWLRRAEASLPPYARAALHFNDQVRAISPEWMHDDSRAADEHTTNRDMRNDFQRRVQSVLGRIFGGQVRLVLALLILSGFATWRMQNERTVSASATPQFIQWQGGRQTLDEPRKSLALRNDYVPDWVCDCVGSWNGGLIGALLLVSSIFSGMTFGILMLLVASAGLFGQEMTIPGLENQSWPAALLAGVLWTMLVIFLGTIETGRKQEALG